jgi:D-alanyl-D-alanine carboxypeptidase
MRKIIFIFILIFSNVTVNASPVIHNAGSVLVMDAQTGEVLFENEGYASRFPASVTKVMTALLVLENVSDLNERIVFSEHAVDLPHYAGRIDMLEGESITVLEALYGIMLPSANEVARALAEHVSGSVPEFVALMNARAEQLGAHHTHFINPCGLPGDGQFITAYDIAIIMRAAIQHPLFAEIISTPYFDLPPTEFHDEVREMRNSNSMVRPSRVEFNPYVVGGKTGFTNAAQHTLVTYARHNEREIIISVLYASPRGAIFTDTAALIDFIFFGISNVPEEIYAEDENDEIDENENDETDEHDEIEEDEIEEHETETVPVFAYVTCDDEPHFEEEDTEPQNENDDYAETVLPAPHEISATEALVTAAFAITTTASALLFLFLIYRQTS